MPTSRSVRICCSPRPICRVSCCTSRSARTCSFPCRRARRPRWRGRRCWPTCRAARSPSGGPRIAACLPGRRRRAVWPPTSTPRRARASPPPIWRGTARRWCGRTACVWPSPSDSPRARDAQRPTWIWTCCARSGCAWAPSTTIAATTGSPRSHSGGWSLRSIRRQGTSACYARSSGSRLCRRMRLGCNRIAMRPTTSRWPASSSGCAH